MVKKTGNQQGRWNGRERFHIFNDGNEGERHSIIADESATREHGNAHGAEADRRGLLPEPAERFAEPLADFAKEKNLEPLRHWIDFLRLSSERFLNVLSSIMPRIDSAESKARGLKC